MKIMSKHLFFSRLFSSQARRLEQLYLQKIEMKQLQPDAYQKKVVERLMDFASKIPSEHQKKTILPFFWNNRSKQQLPKYQGAYLYGGVGTGKTTLLDLFYDSLSQDTLKKRVHFHQFMTEIHRGKTFVFI